MQADSLDMEHVNIDDMLGQLYLVEVHRWRGTAQVVLARAVPQWCSGVLVIGD